MAITEDITQELQTINENYKTTQDAIELTRKMCETVQLHADAKELRKSFDYTNCLVI